MLFRSGFLVTLLCRAFCVSGFVLEDETGREEEEDGCGCGGSERTEGFRVGAVELALVLLRGLLAPSRLWLES